MSSRYHSIISSICSVIESKEDNSFLEIIAISSTMMLADLNDPDRMDSFKNLLEAVLKKYIGSKNRKMIGISHYNLANHHRRRGNSRKSVHHFSQARKYEPDYLNRSYFYSELAGVFFDAQRYSCSMSCYKNALAKGGSVSLLPLYADALMLTGMYKKSREVFNEYFNMPEVFPASEWKLKEMCLGFLVDNLKIESQKRQISGAMMVLEFDNDISINLLYSALEKDSLCSLALFNLGIINSDTDEGLFYFTFSALISRWDVEAWVNATICGFKEPEVMQLIIDAAYTIHAEEYLSSLYEKLSTTCEGELLLNLTNFIEQALPVSSEEKKEIRVPDENGSFHNILK